MRAIILAAGMGTRLRPLTEDTPKSLVKIKGEPIVERQIKFLKEKGINDIIMVVGYRQEKFEYLKDKYNVKLIYNDKYNIYNNIYSMYLIRELLNDCYIIEADVYMVRNYFKTSLQKSTYFSGIKENFDKEWKFTFDNSNRINKIEVGPGTGYIMAGVCYLKERECKIIKENLEKIIERGGFENTYWDDILINNINKLELYISKIDSNDWFEIDCIEDFRKAEHYLMEK